MSVGPVEYIAIAFPGNKFSGKIIPAIKELQDAGTIRVLDIVIISKDKTATSPPSNWGMRVRRKRPPWRSSGSKARTCSVWRTSRTSAGPWTRTARPP